MSEKPPMPEPAEGAKAGKTKSAEDAKKTKAKTEEPKEKTGEEKPNAEEKEPEKSVKENKIDAEPEKQAVETANMSPENQQKFKSMSAAGKTIVERAFQTLERIPGIAIIVGKLNIAYNKFWLSRHKKKAVDLKSKIDNLDQQIRALDRSQEALRATLSRLQEQGIPGAEKIELDIKKIDLEKNDLQSKKDVYQSKLEEYINQAKLCANERDRIADKLIMRFDEKIKVMDQEIETLNMQRDRATLRAALAEVRFKEQDAKIDKLGKEKLELAESLRKAGWSESKIKKFPGIKALEQEISAIKEAINGERDLLAREITAINKKIAEADARANLYRDKRDNFVRIKENRPLEIKVPIREKVGVGFKVEETEAHARKEYLAQKSEQKASKEKETAAETEKYLGLGDYISGWNAYLQEQFGEAVNIEKIDLSDLEKVTGLSRDNKLNFEDFKNILGSYLRLKKLPLSHFIIAIDSYEDTIKKEENK